MVAVLEEIARKYDGIVARAKELSEAANELGLDVSKGENIYIKRQLNKIARGYRAHSVDYKPGSEAILYFEMDEAPTQEMLLKAQSAMKGRGGTLMLGDFSFWKDYENPPMDGYAISFRIPCHLLVAYIPLNPTQTKPTEVSDVVSEVELPTDAQVEISSFYRPHPFGGGYVDAVQIPMKDPQLPFYFNETVGTMLGLFGYKVPEKQTSPVSR